MSNKIRFASLCSLMVLLGCATPSKPLAGSPGGAAPTGTFLPCSQNPERQKTRSSELQTIVNADQTDRADFQKKSMEEMMAMVRRDEERRKRVGEIFGEGCFQRAEDFGAAALVFQHGDMPDHFFQTFLWSKRAVELGDKSKMNLMALGIDRYLVKSDRKQLFGSQAFALEMSNPKSCYCMEPVEHEFPDTIRKQFTGKSLKEAFAWVSSLNSGKNCAIKECPAERRPSPRGTIPGFW